MSAPVESNSNPSPDLQVSLPNVVKFVRQLAHDLRNHLNAAELQSAYLAELAEDAELKEEIKRCGHGFPGGSNLQSLTAALSQPRLTEMRYSALISWRISSKVGPRQPPEVASVNGPSKWRRFAPDRPQVLLPALTELFANAFRPSAAKA